MTFRDIEISMTQQCMFFVYSILLGIVTGIIYDFFRIFRVALRHNAVAVFFEDLLFCLIVSIMLILFIFCENYGIVRWFSFLGWMGGFYIYRQTVGRVVMAAAQMIIKFIKRYIISPISQMIFFIFSSFFRFAAYLFGKCACYTDKLRKYIRCRILLIRAANGFGL